VSVLYYGRETQPVFTIGLLLLNQMVNFSYNLHVKPLESKTAHLYDVVDDCTILLCIYTLYFFLAGENADHKYISGWLLITVMGLNIAYRLIITVVEIIVEIVKSIKRFCRNCK
jgi:hypothetical protein